MLPAGSGAPPNIFQLSSTCSTSTGKSVVTFTCNKVIAGSTCEIILYDTTDPSQQAVWSGVFSTENAKDFTITGKPNGLYKLRADNGEATQEADVAISCSGGPAPAPGCSIALGKITPIAPTIPGGYGAIQVEVLGIQSGEAQVRLYGANGAYLTYQTAYPAPNNVVTFTQLLPGYNGNSNDYKVWAQEAGQNGLGQGCHTQEEPVTVGLAPVPVPPPVLPPVYYPVGGVQPNPVRLPAVVSTLVDGAGLPRLGLHLELELRGAAVGAATFATARKTVRKLKELVDVAAYLRPQLVARPGYSAVPGKLVRDPATAFAFAYRYREVDNATTGDWVDMPNPNFAVLAAMPPSSPELDIVAEVGSGCSWAPAFPSGAAVQFLGYPLEVGVVIPDRAPNLATFLEIVYYDAAGAAIEIRTWPVLATAAAGYYRICLPQDVLPCAVKEVLAICNEDRHYTGSCPTGFTPGTTPTLPPVSTPGGFITTGKGYIKRK